MVWATFIIFKYARFENSSFDAALSNIALAFGEIFRSFLICSAESFEFCSPRSCWIAFASLIFFLMFSSSFISGSDRKFFIDIVGVSMKISNRSSSGPESLF